MSQLHPPRRLDRDPGHLRRRRRRAASRPPGAPAASLAGSTAAGRAGRLGHGQEQQARRAGRPTRPAPARRCSATPTCPPGVARRRSAASPRSRRCGRRRATRRARWPTRTHGSCSSRAAAAPALTSSSGGWPARPACATTCAAVSCTLPVTVTERAENSGVCDEEPPADEEDRPGQADDQQAQPAAPPCSRMTAVAPGRDARVHAPGPSHRATPCRVRRPAAAPPPRQPPPVTAAATAASSRDGAALLGRGHRSPRRSPVGSATPPVSRRRSRGGGPRPAASPRTAPPRRRARAP